MVTAIACCLALAAPTVMENISGESLKELAAKRGLTIGTCVSTRFLVEDDYAKVLATQFSMLEPENEMKFASLHPEKDRYDFTAADQQVAFAKKHGMAVRGHTLIWHSQVAGWVHSGKFTPEQLNAIAKDHIFKVMGHYKGKVKEWDVVNEAIGDNAKVRSSLWYDKPGIGFAGQDDKFIEQSFRWAHEADPGAKLFYNDYSIEWIGPKSDKVYEMLKGFVARKVPVHGLGMQCHFDLQFAKPEPIKSFGENIRRFKALGLDVQLTELDVRLPDNSPESLEKQAYVYREIIKTALKEGVKTIQLWGFTDKHSWIPGTFPGRGWALPWDDKYQPKPALQAIQEALAGRR